MHRPPGWVNLIRGAPLGHRPCAYKWRCFMPMFIIYRKWCANFINYGGRCWQKLLPKGPWRSASAVKWLTIRSCARRRRRRRWSRVRDLQNTRSRMQHPLITQQPPVQRYLSVCDVHGWALHGRKRECVCVCASEHHHAVCIYSRRLQRASWIIDLFACSVSTESSLCASLTQLVAWCIYENQRAMHTCRRRLIFCSSVLTSIH